MTDAPLAAIRDKEQEIEARLTSAKESAQAILAQARSDATRLEEQAREKAVVDATKEYDKALATSRLQADKIRLAVPEELKTITSRVETRKKEVVDHIVDAVLPRT